jgi:hypothetical protein
VVTFVLLDRVQSEAEGARKVKQRRRGVWLKRRAIIRCGEFVGYVRQTGGALNNLSKTVYDLNMEVERRVKIVPCFV